MRIVGVGWSSPEANADWAAREGYAYALWSDTDRVLSEAYGVVAPWDADELLRHAFILDATGAAVVRHDGGVSLGADPAGVLADCRTLFGG